MKTVRWVRGTCSKLLFNPGDVQALADRFKKLRQELVPFKVAAADFSFSKRELWRRLQNHAEPVILLRGGKPTANYPKETIEKVLRAP